VTELRSTAGCLISIIDTNENYTFCIVKSYVMNCHVVYIFQ